MTLTACPGDTRNERRLQAERLVGPAALHEAQALRFRVFSSEFKARLKGAEHGLDMDDYDIHCQHIGVRDLNSGHLVATTRLLDHQAASSLGASTAKRSSACMAWAICRAPSLNWGAPASTRPTATAAPSRCCGASLPRYSTRAATAT